MVLDQENILPRVTIMIPTYGQDDTILRAVDSALAQDYLNLEVIVSDDSSPDNTTNVVAKRKDSRLIYHCNPVNLGRVGNYRNALYSLASGEWVINLDGDDYFIDPGFISAAVKLASTDKDILIVSARCVTETPTRRIVSDIPKQHIVDGKEVVLQLVNDQFRFKHMTTLYNRPKALACDFYRVDLLSSDWESLYRLATCGKVAYLDRVVGVWWVHGNNDSLSSDWKALRDNLNIWKSIYEEAIRNGASSSKVKKAEQDMIYFIAYFNISTIFSGNNPRHAINFSLALRKISYYVFFRMFINYKFISKLIISFIYPKYLKRIL